MKYAVWREATPEFAGHAEPAAIHALMEGDLRRKAEADGVAVDTSAARVEVSDQAAGFFIRDRVAVLMEAPVAYTFNPVGDQIGSAVRRLFRSRWFPW